MSYSIQQITPLAGGNSTEAWGINSAGYVAGGSDKVFPSGTHRLQAIQWHPTFGISELPMWSGGETSVGISISDSGFVAGEITNGDGGSWQVVWANGTANGLGVQYTGKPLCMNNAGQVVGSYFIGQEQHAYLINPLDANNDGVPDTWRQLDKNNQNTLLVHLDEPNAIQGIEGGILYEAHWINDKGQIAGVGNQNGKDVAVLLDTTDILIPDLGGGSGAALCINSFGKVVGVSQTATGQGHGFIWQAGLGSLDMDSGVVNATPFAVNKSGTAVGRAIFQNEPGPRAFVWNAGGGLQDLNTLIRPGSGWYLREARGINDQGSIVGNGTLNDAARGFLLQPAGGFGRAFIAQVQWILWSVVADGPGQVWPGGPVSPWNPMERWQRVSTETRDLLLATLTGELASLINDSVATSHIREASLKAVRDLAEQDLKRRN
jgi:probable HAF family extracellular repeat protein